MPRSCLERDLHIPDDGDVPQMTPLILGYKTSREEMTEKTFNLLNVLGECCVQSGKAEDALAAWKRALEINPNQPQIKKNVEALKERK